MSKGLVRFSHRGPEDPHQIPIPTPPGSEALSGLGVVLLVASLSSGHIRILDFSLDGGTENVTKCYSNLFPGPILNPSCTIFRAGPVWRGPGAQCGRTPIANRPKLKSIFEFPSMTATGSWSTQTFFQGPQRLKVGSLRTRPGVAGY